MPNNSFRKVKVDKRSGFDKSFRNSITAKCGTLVPILVDELCPDTKVHLREALAASLPPLVSDTYMNVRLRVEAFVVPHRLCQANFDDFFDDYPVETLFSVSSSGFSFTENLRGCMPLMRINQNDESGLNTFFGKGSLGDYLGVPFVSELYSFDVVAAPFIAYHLIWNEWYRNPRVQKSAFVRPEGTSAAHVVFIGDNTTTNFSNKVMAATMPYCSYFFDVSGNQPIIRSFTSSDVVYFNGYDLADGAHIYDLRQRNFGLDFFTAAMNEPQQGPAAVVKFGQNGDPADGFTISSLRAQNSIQQFRERNGLTSPRYQQQIYARYGVAPSDGVIQRPVLIGAATYDVYSHGVVAQAYSDTAGPNPFNGKLGARAGNGFATGSDFLISDFHAKEPMYLIVLASLVPEVSYSQNFAPYLLRYKGVGSITDMANGILQNVGPEPIYNGEVSVCDTSTEFYGVFAYTDRYSKWMIMNNQVHGEFKESGSGSLSAFVLQRTFSDVPEFGSEFLEIPTDYLDGVLQISTAVMGLTYWLDIAFDYKVSMPLQEYAIPSLQDPGYEHGRTISLRKNGQLL